MSRKMIGIGLVLLGLIWVGVMVLSNDARSPLKISVSSSSPPSSDLSANSGNNLPVISVEVVAVSRQHLKETIPLPGELLPFLSVDLSPKISGIVHSITVDRGSTVKKGDVLIHLKAPELPAQIKEAEARLRGATITYTRLQAAAATPGIVAGNDLELAQHHQDELRAHLQSLQEMEKYLRVVAPFDGVITQRNIHPGAVVGPDSGGRTSSLLRLEQIVRLRLVVPVPEAYTGSVAQGTTVVFTVPAYPEETFQGVVSRVSRSLETKTRSMPVEMNVDNPTMRLAAGMFPEVRWPIRRSASTLFVPATAVVTTTEKTFVLRVNAEHLVEWISLRKGSRSGPMVEVFGALTAGDLVVIMGTDEIRPGSRVRVIEKDSTAKDPT